MRLRRFFGKGRKAAQGTVEPQHHFAEMSSEAQRDLLRMVREQRTEAAGARCQLERERQQVRAHMAETEALLHRALDLDQTDVAQVLLERQVVAVATFEDLGQQLAQAAEIEQKFALAERQLVARLEARSTREQDRAAYPADGIWPGADHWLPAGGSFDGADEPESPTTGAALNAAR